MHWTEYLPALFKGAQITIVLALSSMAIGTVLLFFAILFGVFPSLVLRYMDKTIDQQTQQLADWTAAVKEVQPTSTPVGNALRGVPEAGKVPETVPVATDLPGAE